MKKNVFVSIVLAICSVSFAQTQKPKQLAKNTIEASIANGKLVYQKACLSCHQADGGGVPRLNPPMSESTTVLGEPKKLIQIVLKGMTDRVPIDGEYYSNSMAPHNYLTDKEIADVLTYVRNSFGNKAPAITANEVKLVRGGKKK
jgi:mono/diheme cytochrome c family protein